MLHHWSDAYQMGFHTIIMKHPVMKSRKQQFFSNIICSIKAQTGNANNANKNITTERQAELQYQTQNIEVNHAIRRDSYISLSESSLLLMTSREKIRRNTYLGQNPCLNGRHKRCLSRHKKNKLGLTNMIVKKTMLYIPTNRESSPSVWFKQNSK